MTKPTVDQLLDAAISAVPAGEIRPGQQQMAAAIAESLDTGVHLLAQAVPAPESHWPIWRPRFWRTDRW